MEDKALNLEGINKILNTLKDKLSRQEEVNKDDFKLLFESEFEALVQNMKS